MNKTNRQSNIFNHPLYPVLQFESDLVNHHYRKILPLHFFPPPRLLLLHLFPPHLQLHFL